MLLTYDPQKRNSLRFDGFYSDSSKLTQAASAIWKMDDFADAFYHLEAASPPSVNAKLELKLSGIVDVKNKPASPELEKTDTALLAALVFKF